MSPNLEVFKFGFYLFFPVAMLWRFGDPDWYDRNVIPYKQKIFPQGDRIVKNLPTDRAAIREELERRKAATLQRRLERERSQNNP